MKTYTTKPEDDFRELQLEAGEILHRIKYYQDRDNQSIDRLLERLRDFDMLGYLEDLVEYYADADLDRDRDPDLDF